MGQYVGAARPLLMKGAQAGELPTGALKGTLGTGEKNRADDQGENNCAEGRSPPRHRLLTSQCLKRRPRRLGGQRSASLLPASDTESGAGGPTWFQWAVAGA